MQASKCEAPEIYARSSALLDVEDISGEADAVVRYGGPGGAGFGATLLTMHANRAVLWPRTPGPTLGECRHASFNSPRVRSSAGRHRRTRVGGSCPGAVLCDAAGRRVHRDVRRVHWRE